MGIIWVRSGRGSSPLRRGRIPRSIWKNWMSCRRWFGGRWLQLWEGRGRSRREKLVMSRSLTRLRVSRHFGFDEFNWRREFWGRSILFQGFVFSRGKSGRSRRFYFLLYFRLFLELLLWRFRLAERVREGVEGARGDESSFEHFEARSAPPTSLYSVALRQATSPWLCSKKSWRLSVSDRFSLISMTFR